MTDRLKGFVVTLEHVMREDDAEAVLGALRMVRGVADVVPVKNDIDDQMNRLSVRRELAAALWKALDT